jgi:hypothetical protein
MPGRTCRPLTSENGLPVVVVDERPLGHPQGGSVPDHQDKEAETEREIEREAAKEETDPITSREALEEDLMDKGESQAGEHIP